MMIAQEIACNSSGLFVRWAIYALARPGPCLQTLWMGRPPPRLSYVAVARFTPVFRRKDGRCTAVKPCRSRRCSLVSTPSQPGHAHVHQGPGTGAAGLAARILGKSSWMMCMSSISQMRAWCSGARVVQRLQGSLATSCKSVLRSQGGCCREIDGSEKKNVAPCPTAPSAHIRPAWRATILCVVARPMPVPANSSDECRR